MEEAAAVRRAALAAVDDVEPGRLRDRLEARLDDAPVAPGVLTMASADAVADQHVEDVADRAAAVQLIYEGLRLTRTLAHADPWGAAGRRPPESDDAVDPVTANGGTGVVADADAADADAADLDILVADILVARGFYLLARTEAAAAAVRVVRSFGSDQTVRRATGDASLDHNLEADVLELAVVAGTTAAGGRAPDRLRSYVADLAADGLPALARVDSDDVRDALSALAGSEPPASDGVRTSADY